MSSKIYSKLGIVIPIVVLLSLYVLLQTPVRSLSHPRMDRAVHTLQKNANIVFLGNSVTSTLNTKALEQELGSTTSKVILEGGMPAHWAALLAQGRLRYKLNPQKIIIYAPAHNWLDTQLLDETDIVLLKQLSPEQVPSLEQRALGEESSVLFPNRLALRERLLQTISETSISIFWPQAYPFIEQARIEVLGATVPQSPTDMMQAPNTPARHQSSISATKASIENSILPLIMEEAKKLSAELIFALPAQSEYLPTKCLDRELPDGVDWIVQSGFRVLDFRSLPFGKDRFQSLHHLSEKGAIEIAPWLAKGIKAEERFWVAGCH